MRIRAVLVGLAVIGTTACTDATGVGGDNAGGDFDVSIGVGVTPNYAWPSGLAFEVDVVRTANSTVSVWRVANPTQRNITSPVRHGQVPTGALVLANTEPSLTAGIAYRVTIRLADGQSAFREFRP
jgi:hypothetical protein